MSVSLGEDLHPIGVAFFLRDENDVSHFTIFHTEGGMRLSETGTRSAPKP